MDTILIYFPFKIQNSANSGSKLRPIKILQAFKDWGKLHNIKVLLIAGESKEREDQFKAFRNNGYLDNLLFCYIENQTIPIWLTDTGHIPKRPFIDWQILSFLKVANVPVGIFYRDVYWKFDDIYPLRGIKKQIMKIIYRLEEMFFQQYAHTIFLPTLNMAKFVNINRPVVALPPGGSEVSSIEPKVKSKQVYNAIYVGAISHKMYGLSLLLDVVDNMRSKNIDFNLTIVCRHEELYKISNKERMRIKDLNINIEHRTSSSLPSLYAQMDIALMPLTPTVYNNFAVPTKLLEYLSYHLPVVATCCTAQIELISSGPYGIVCEPNVESFTNTIIQMFSNIEFYKSEIAEKFYKDNSWITRVQTVYNTLTKGRV